MTLPAPTVVYRTRVYQDAESVTAYLRQSGINARLVSPQEVGHMGEGPVFDVLHDVLAADCKQDDVLRLIEQWRGRIEDTRKHELPFCYFCGETLGSMTVTCPSCGNSLDADGTKPLHGDG